MTPHPFATWMQMQVSPQREPIRRRRRRLAARLLRDSDVEGVRVQAVQAQRARWTRPSSHTGPSDSNTVPSAP